MKAAQLADRMVRTIVSNTIRLDSAMRIQVYEAIIDELEREMGRIEEENDSEDERFRNDNDESEGDDY